jgi:hypothetical protein
LAVEAFFFSCEFSLAAALDRKDRVGMKFLDSSVTGVCFKFGKGYDAYARFLEKPEIMPFPIGKGGTDNLPCTLINNNLCFYCVPLFLP